MYPSYNKNLFYVSIILVLSACSSNKAVDKSFNIYSDTIAVNEISVSEKEAHLVFYRAPQDRNDTSNVANIFVNDRYLSTLLTEGYTELSVCPGANKVFVTAREGNELSPDYAPKTMYLEAGKTYFIELNKDVENKYQSRVLMSHEEVSSSIQGLKRQAHTIGRYAEDCAVKLAKEQSDARANDEKKSAETSGDASSSLAAVAVLPAPVVPSSTEEMSAHAVRQSIDQVRILFPFAQFDFATVDAEGRHALHAFADDYKHLKITKKIRLSGHADPIGDEDANILLSQKRIKAIHAALQAEGVRADFEEDALGSRKVLVDCSGKKNTDDLGAVVTHSQKGQGVYWVQLYAAVSSSKNINVSDYKKIADKLKVNSLLKNSSDGFVRVLLGGFNNFSSAMSAVKASGIKDAFVRFVSKNSDTSTQSCNQPNRRVDVEVVE